MFSYVCLVFREITFLMVSIGLCLVFHSKVDGGLCSVHACKSEVPHMETAGVWRKLFPSQWRGEDKRSAPTYIYIYTHREREREKGVVKKSSQN